MGSGPLTGADPAEPAIVAAVLAAGGSTRMRRGHKLLLPFPDEPVIRIAVRAAERAGFAPVGVVVGERGEDLSAALADRPVELVCHPNPEAGLASSVVLALDWARACGAGALLLLLADEPGMDPEVIRAAADAWRASRPLALRVRYRDRPGHPVVVAADADPCGALSGDRGLGGWLRALGDALVELPVDAASPVDVDSDEAYLEALARLPH